MRPIRAHFTTGDSAIKFADTVKIDAEGAELNVLLGIKRLIESSVPVFLIENKDYLSVTKFLRAYGYDVYRFDVKTSVLQAMHDLTTNCFYLKTRHF